MRFADANIKSTQVQVEIADESYSPKFGVEVLYAHREANGMGGQPAPDLVSAYLTMDIPLFTDKRQYDVRFTARAILARKSRLCLSYFRSKKPNITGAFEV
ncbi:TolC family protein [Vibrio sp. S11_S32]|uniref:TolC family protein n=1 Tax=Vibrio sp. S11_S32 TaxID=2720225 RepID=UPI00406C62B7